MKVLMFGWEFPPHNSGGLGVACRGLAQGLTRRGVDVIFVLPKKVGVRSKLFKIVFADIPRLVVRGVTALLAPYVTPESYTSVRALQESRIYGYGLFDEVRRYAVRARAIAQKESFDIIHAHDWLSFPAGLEARRVSGKPLVVHVHATEFDRTGGHSINRDVYAVEKEGMEEADAVIAVSHFTKDMIVRHYGIDPRKIHVVHNAVESMEQPLTTVNLAQLKNNGTKIVLFVGRITLQKGPDYFLRAAEKVLHYNPEVIFIVAGSGDMETRMIEEAARLGIGDKVLFAGFLRGEELRAIYQAADLYVLPSVSEPFGITPLESLANGTPVLISKQSGVAEVLTHALKVDFWDTNEMANKIIAVLSHDSLKQCLVEHGQKEIEKLNWETAAEKCIHLYNDISRAP